VNEPHTERHRTQPLRFGLAVYRIATRAVGPLVPFLLSRRLKRGKEDAARLDERRGETTRARPDGVLVWIHAASVGESLSVLPLINHILAARDDAHVLVTTGTVTSAKLMAERLPPRALHQYVPLDHPDFCAAFLDHWRPDLGVWVESEFWPNLITTSDERGIPLVLVNARITQKSFEGWQRFPKTIADLVGRFSLVFAQDKASATRLEALGVRRVATPGNLKHDADPLTADAGELATLRRAIGTRAIWLATNTHDGEEMIAADAHMALLHDYPGLLTLIVPRHPARGDEIARQLHHRGLGVVQRSTGQTIDAGTDIYLADTLGELGLFYRLSSIVFIGGTMADIGGHNPFEPARLNNAMIAGPSEFNFTEAFATFANAGALVRVADSASLAAAVSDLLGDDTECRRRADAAEAIVAKSSAATRVTCEALIGLLPAALAESAVSHA
tara:strand:- start:2699 stop:4036 length:1338 start_codon:yes stop_codon:yes gene_type:complete